MCFTHADCTHAQKTIRTISDCCSSKAIHICVILTKAIHLHEDLKTLPWQCIPYLSLQHCNILRDSSISRRRNNNSSQYEYALNLSYNLPTKDILILIRVPSSWMLIIKIIKKKFQLTSKWQIREIPVESHSLTKWVERGWSVQFVNILFLLLGILYVRFFYL